MLSIVSTPIGNLGDITLRALEALKNCDLVVCEDTRVTGNLLKLLNLPKKELMSFHGYTDPGKVDVILRKLGEGKHVVLVSDAGTPGISDPGYAVVSEVTKRGEKIEVLPGPAAFLTALSGSGLPINAFTYLGFPPAKKGRQTFFQALKDYEGTVVFYESVHRIDNALQMMFDFLKEDDPTRPVVIARELTKMHEEFVRCTVKELPEVMKNLTLKGEFAVVIGPRE